MTVRWDAPPGRSGGWLEVADHGKASFRAFSLARTKYDPPKKYQLLRFEVYEREGGLRVYHFRLYPNGQWKKASVEEAQTLNGASSDDPAHLGG